jgi:hypothetical protein
MSSSQADRPLPPPPPPPRDDGLDFRNPDLSGRSSSPGRRRGPAFGGGSDRGHLRQLVHDRLGPLHGQLDLVADMISDTSPSNEEVGAVCFDGAQLPQETAISLPPEGSNAGASDDALAADHTVSNSHDGPASMPGQAGGPEVVRSPQARPSGTANDSEPPQSEGAPLQARPVSYPLQAGLPASTQIEPGSQVQMLPPDCDASHSGVTC